MADKKTTELPENTSLNNNDKIYHASAGGASKFMRLSTLVNFIISLLPPSTGGAVEKYLGRIATADIPTTGELGEYFQNSDTGTYWKWTPDDSEDPDGPGSFQDTGDLIESIEFDVYPILGSVNAVTSDGIFQALANKANTEHIHSTSEAWLSDVINLLVTKTGFIDQLVAKIEQGTGIVISTTGEGKLRISRSGAEEGGSGDWGSIGGDILLQLDLMAEFAKYQEPPVWTPVTPVDGVVTLPAVNGSQDYYEWTESGPDTLAHSGTFKDAGFKYARVTLASSSYTITLGSGYVDKRGKPKTTIPLTGEPGDEVEFYLLRKGSSWIVYEDGGNLAISDVTGLQAELDDLQTQIDGLSGGGGPAIAETYATIAARDADVANRTAGELVLVTDASADVTVDAGYAYYEFEGGSTWRKLSEQESMDVEATIEDFAFTATTFGATTTLNLEEKSEPKHEFTANSATTNLVLTNKKTGSSKGLLKVNFSGVVSLAITLDPAFTHRQAGKAAITAYTLKQANGESDYIDYVINGTVIDWFFPDIDELAQDAVGAILDDGTVGDIVHTYNDTTPKISSTIKSKAVTYAKIAGTTGSTERVLITTAAGDVQSTTEIQPYRRDDLLTILDGATWAGDTYTITGQTPNNGLQGQFTLNVTTHYRYDCVVDGQWTRTPLARSWVNVYGVPSPEKTKLETLANWTGKEYTGTAITGTFQGQKHYDANYLFEAVSDNIWIRTARS